MLCGFAAVLYAIHGQLERACWLILLAALLDGLDGRMRASPAQLGVQSGYDSRRRREPASPCGPRLPVRTRGGVGWAATPLLVAGSVRGRYNVKA
jgi:hypothetical protein